MSGVRDKYLFAGTVLALLLAFALRMACLAGRALWYDEAFALFYASLTPSQMIDGTVTPVEGAGAADVHPLFYYFLLHGWMERAGRSPLAARFLSVALGMVTLALLGRLAAWLFGRQAGLAATLLAAVNPFHVAYSQEARMYALLALAAVAATWGLLRALCDRRCAIRDWSFYAVAAAGTLYAHNLGVMFVAALHVLALSRRRWWRRLPSLLIADLFALALFSPWLIGVLPGQVGFVGKGYWLTPPGTAEVVRLPMQPVLTFYEPAPFWLLGLALFLGLLLLILLALRIGQSRSRAGWFLLLWGAPPALLFLVSQWRPLYLERALLPSALMLLVALGWLLTRGGLPRLLRLGLAALLAMATAGSLCCHYTYERFPRPPFAQLDAFLRARLAPGEVIVHDNKLTFFPAFYYGPDLPQTFCPDLPGSGSDTLARPTQEALGLFATPIDQIVRGDVAGAWYIAFEQTWAEYQALGLPDAPNRAWLRAHCRQEGEVRTIADLEIYHFIDCEVGP